MGEVWDLFCISNRQGAKAMNFFKQWGRFMMAGARAHARWGMDVSRTILGDRKRMIILGLLLMPAILGGIAFASEISEALPDVLGGKKAYSPAFYSLGIFIASILIGLARASSPAASGPAAASSSRRP